MIMEKCLIVNDEVWKDIKNYEGCYQISNYGRVKTLSRKRVKECIMSLDCNKGYARITLSKNNMQKHYFVHQLVLQTFKNDKSNFKHLENENIDDIDLSKLEINHIDENPKNNKLENLEWCTHMYNLCYGTRIAKVVEKARKPVNQYDMNGNFIRQHYSLQQAARNIDRGASPICLCCQGKQSSAYGYIWKYATKGGGV